MSASVAFACTGKRDVHGVRWPGFCDWFHRGLGGLTLAMGQLYRKKGSHSLRTPPKVYITFPSVLNCFSQVKRNKGLCVKVTVFLESFQGWGEGREEGQARTQCQPKSCGGDLTVCREFWRLGMYPLLPESLGTACWGSGK